MGVGWKDWLFTHPSEDGEVVRLFALRSHMGTSTSPFGYLLEVFSSSLVI